MINTAVHKGKETADKIISGYRLSREDDLSFFLTEDLSSLCQNANRIREAFRGNSVQLCSIINGRCGQCSEDCKFCAQSSHYHANIEEHPFLSPETILADCRYHISQKVGRYSIVTAGKKLEGKDFQTALSAYRIMAEEGNIGLCASHGLLSQDAFFQLKEAGITRYHANIETSERNFPNICTTHSFADKLETISRAKQAGLEICSGGIIGMGESWEDRIDMALTLSRLKVDSIPLNILQPIKGTPFEHLKPISEEDSLRTIAIFRYINPEISIRLAAGRISMRESGKYAFLSGADSAITGDMLTTSGNRIAQDRDMLASIGFSLR